MQGRTSLGLYALQWVVFHLGVMVSVPVIVGPALGMNTLEIARLSQTIFFPHRPGEFAAGQVRPWGIAGGRAGGSLVGRLCAFGRYGGGNGKTTGIGPDRYWRRHDGRGPYLYPYGVGTVDHQVAFLFLPPASPVAGGRWLAGDLHNWIKSSVRCGGHVITCILLGKGAGLGGGGPE